MQSERSNLGVSNKITRNIKDHQKLCELLGVICIYAFAPLIVIILIFFYIYRRLVEIVLKIQFNTKFAGLLEGTDSVWAVENNVSRSIINILLILENNAQSTNVNFLENFRNLINNRIISKTGTSLEKFLYCRAKKFGYYFWKRSEEVNLKDKIRWLECEDANCDGSCEDISSEAFRRNFGNVCNRPLPDDNTATWEILIGKRCERSRSRVEEDRLSPEDHLNTKLYNIPIIFRIHHALGDGLSLQQVVLKAISEEGEMKMEKITNDGISNNLEKDFKEIVSPWHNLEKNLRGEMEVERFYYKDIIASIPFIYVFLSQITIGLLKQQTKMWINHRWLNFKNLLKQSCEKIAKLMRLMMIILSAPQCLIQQTIRSMDENAFKQSSYQTGEKLVSYWFENDVNKSQKFLMKIRKIKNSTGARFGDVILAAFSVIVHKYHLRINKPVPDALTAVIPIRLAVAKDKLDNEFSMAYQQICISNVNGKIVTEPHKDSEFFKRLRDITKVHDEIKKSNILVNFWIMKYLCAILPVQILHVFLLNMSSPTMGFSNMCGSQKRRILNNTMSNLIFLLPTKDTVALGLSVISYGGNLHLGLIADKSVIKNERFFMEILKDTVQEIDIAYNNITHVNPAETPMEKDISVL